uniref:Uncharacterized protein LOC105051629 n=1 Tax=Elaeis guineensis var. tenera TaxID=51953 RepID=A0A8N4F082_ELAGV|nr:uncharacterized protein LOC105051629 [Elaeis guineensis]
MERKPLDSDERRSGRNGPKHLPTQPRPPPLCVSLSNVKVSSCSAELSPSKSKKNRRLFRFIEIRSFEIPSLLAAILSPRGTCLQTLRKSIRLEDKKCCAVGIRDSCSRLSTISKELGYLEWFSVEPLKAPGSHLWQNLGSVILVHGGMKQRYIGACS